MFLDTDTNFVFQPGKLTTCLDGGAGSSGKGKLGAFITEHADNWQFACSTFAPQSGHWVRNEGGEYFYQTFNSCAYQDKYEMLYIGPGGIIELPAFFREIEESSIDPEKIRISPVCAILQNKDSAFERGEVDLDGNQINLGDGTMKRGSTCHGVGACTARRRLRRPDTLLARDIPRLKEFLCDVPGEIMDRLDSGQSGILEIAQGFQLSYLLPEMYPFCTSRNCTVAAGFDDLMVPPAYAGNVVLNYRTYPIRISNYKYIAETEISAQQAAADGFPRALSKGAHLWWDEVELFKEFGYKYTIYEGNSGPGYDDQEETSWDEVTKSSGSLTRIMEITSVTKLPRRVFTFSRKNVEQSIRHNKTTGRTFLSINFVNYVDHELSGKRIPGARIASLGHKMANWYENNLAQVHNIAELAFLGTGAMTDDFIQIAINGTQ